MRTNEKECAAVAAPVLEETNVAGDKAELLDRVIRYGFVGLFATILMTTTAYSLVLCLPKT